MNKITIGFALAGLSAVCVPQALAETVLLEKTSLVSGSQSFAYEVQAPGQGRLNVTLSNLDWPERLGSLSFAASTATSVVKTFDGPGTFSFSVSGPGAYYAHVAGVAQGALDLGLFSLRVTFDALGSPVPLPAAAWLLLTGLGAFASAFRGRAREG